MDVILDCKIAGKMGSQISSGVADSRSKAVPGDLAKAFLEASGALIGLVVFDNLLGFTKTPYANQIAYGVAAIVLLIRIVSRKRSWEVGYVKAVYGTIAWMFLTMGIIILIIGGEKQLDFFSTLGLSPFNVGVGIYLFFGIALPEPIVHACRLGQKV